MTIAATTTIAIRPRGLGGSPASSVASRFAPITIATSDSASTVISANSNVPSPVVIASVVCATAGTGTPSTPSPRAPCAVIRTCSEPRSISHELAVKNCGSAGARSAGSAVGGRSLPGPVSRSGWTSIDATSGDDARISICATPGMTLGMRIVTNSSYGPAWPSKNTSGLPTCALATPHNMQRITNARFIAAPCAARRR